MQNLLILFCILSFPWNKKEEKEEKVIMKLWVVCEDYKDGSLIINDYGEFKLNFDIETKIKEDPEFLTDTLEEPINLSNVFFPCYLELEVEVPYLIEEVSEILDSTKDVLSIRYIEQVDLIKIKEEKRR